jgi:hypothetical protein
MWVLPFAYPTLVYLLWPNKGPIRMALTQGGLIGRLLQRRLTRRWILEEQGKKMPITEIID